MKPRPPRATKKRPVVPKQKTDRAEDELKANLHALTLSRDDDPEDGETKMQEDDATFRIEDIPLSIELPKCRFNAALAVGMDDKLYIYGGTYEEPGRGEQTLDDFHVIDLGKLDGVRQLWNRTITPPDEEDASDSESSGEDSDPMEDVSETTPQEEDVDIDILPTQVPVAGPSTTEDSSPTTSFNPSYPQPLPFETLKAYYERTGEEWAGLISNKSKAGRREAFGKAETYWWECREEIREIEEHMEDSGVNEVVVAQSDRKQKRR